MKAATLHSVTLLFLGLMLVACNGTTPQAKKELPLRTQEDVAKIVPVPDTTRVLLSTTKRYYNAFPVARMVRLREGKHVITSVDELAFVDDTMFVKDMVQQLVFRCSIDGDILGVVGSKGRGPGEYTTPHSIQSIWGGRLAIADGFGPLLVYDVEGTFLFSFKNGDGLHVPRAKFAWPAPNRFYANFFLSFERVSELNRIMDYTDLKHPKMVGTFETRHAFPSSFSTPSYIGFCLVGDQIWSVNPHGATIRIFSGQGQLKREISLGREDQLTPEVYGELVGKYKEERAFDKALLGYEAFSSMHYADGVVVVRTNRGFQLFDTQGEALTPLMYREPGQVIGVYKGMPVTELIALPRSVDEVYYTKSIPEAYAMMVELGFDWDNPGDDLYLHFGKLVK